MPQQTSTHSDTTHFLGGPEVCRRYGIVPMTLFRWLRDRDLGFPQPAMLVRDRRYWREADLIVWERHSAPRRYRA